MPTAKKLPSGSWRCQVFSHYEENKQPDGTIKKKRIYESFTSDDTTNRGKKEAEAKAATFALNKERTSKSNITFSEALQRYIDSRSEILSPASIRKYRSMEKNLPNALLEKKIKQIDSKTIQVLVNELAVSKSPKTIRDIHGLISAVLKQNNCNVVLNTAMPKKIRPELYIPTDTDIKELISAVMGTDMAIPVYLAAFGAMRRGEIAALTSQDIDCNIIHINKTMVLSTNNKWIVKAPKSYAGDRFIEVPEFVGGLLKNKTGNITGLTPNKITSRFEHVLKNAGIHHFRFHDLRHYCASISHALGIPDVYIMQMGGWGNDRVLKEVYRHAFEDTRKEMNAIAIQHFESMQHEMQHENKKAQ